MPVYGDWQPGIVWDALLRMDTESGSAGQIVHLGDHPEPPDPGLRVGRITRMRGAATVTSVTPSAGHSEAMWDSAREGGPTSNPTNSTSSTYGPQAAYAASNPGMFSLGSVQWVTDVHGLVVILSSGDVEHTGTPPVADWPTGAIGVQSETGVDLVFSDGVSLTWSERPGGLATGLGAQFDVVVKEAGVDGPDLMQLNAGHADTLATLTGRAGPATPLDVGDLNPLLVYPGATIDGAPNTRALFLYWAFAALIDDERPAGTDGAGNLAWKINTPDFDLAFQFQTAPWRYVFEDGYVPPPETIEDPVRRWPRDDGLAMASAPRIHPPPRSGRLVGGIQ